MIDIYEIQRYVNYEVDLSMTADMLVETVYAKAREYLPESSIVLIQSAFEFAKHAHEGVKRLSGEDYITHPVHATIYLMNIRPDVHTIQACLMHDVIEDTDYTYDDILDRFGAETARLCQSMVKVGKVKYRGEERNLETWKKTFLAMAEDVRVIFIKLADRIHNTQTLKFHPEPSKAARIATETLHVHASIAKRLGLYDFQLLLENGAYAILEPDKFHHVMEHMLELYGSDENYVQTGVDRLTEVMESNAIAYVTIKGRMKSPYRVAQKVFDPSKPYDIYTIHDVLAFRIIVPTISDCYLALGCVHGEYAPEVKKIKDFIARPLENGYQSLHTRVFGLLPFKTEIQIRTPEMDQHAEFGVAAHFAYAESGSKSLKVQERQGQWIQKMQEIVQQYQEDFDGFKHEMNIGLGDNNVFVYTPRGDAIELQAGSTILDFAFRIHSKVGLSYRNGTVNGRIVPIDYELQTGEIVQIITWNNKESCTPAWAHYVKTSQARQAINKYLRASQKPYILKTATVVLNDKLVEYGLPVLGHADSTIKLTTEQLEGALIQIYEKQISPYHFIKQHYPQIQQSSHTTDTESVRPLVSDKETSIIIDGELDLEYTLCGECNPQAPVKIIAKSSAHGIKIHAVGCYSLKDVSYDKFLEAHRGVDPLACEIYQVIFDVNIVSGGTLIPLLRIFQELHIPVLSVHFTNADNGDAHGQIIGEFMIPSKIHYIIKQIDNISSLILKDIVMK